MTPEEVAALATRWLREQEGPDAEYEAVVDRVWLEWEERRIWGCAVGYRRRDAGDEIDGHTIVYVDERTETVLPTLPAEMDRSRQLFEEVLRVSQGGVEPS